MGTTKHSYRIKDRGKGFTKTVVYWDPELGRQVEKSTGEKDPKRAQVRAAAIVAKALAGVTTGGRQCVALSTEKLAAEYIRSLRNLLDDKTLAAYALSFETHLVPEFPTLADVTTPNWRAYIQKRLGKVQASTVRKELSPMRGLMEWCRENGKIDELPHLPGIPKRATGTQFKIRRRSKPDPISPEEARAIIDALPETCEGKPVRSRYLLQYSMGLRSHTIDKLELGKHWVRGSDWLLLAAKDLKGRIEKRKRLTTEAKAALVKATIGMESGVIFGKTADDKDHVELIRAAAALVLDSERAARFAPTHLRSAAITHFLDAGAPLTAAQAFADHKLATTTDRYVRASQRALEAELRRQGRI